MITKKRNGYAIGVVSDTHGQMAPALFEMLSEVDLIIHAGDIDRPEILDLLKSIAPVVAVRGNMDRGDWAGRLSRSELVTFQNKLFYVVHNIEDMDIDPEFIGADAVISGHTHKAQILTKGQVLYVNPGSVSLPRGGSPPTLAVIRISGKTLDPRVYPVGTSSDAD